MSAIVCLKISDNQPSFQILLIIKFKYYIQSMLIQLYTHSMLKFNYINFVNLKTYLYFITSHSVYFM